jgi:subtilase family serine protease
VVWNDRGFSVNVDSRNTINESNETNNTAAVAR